MAHLQPPEVGPKVEAPSPPSAAAGECGARDTFDEARHRRSSTRTSRSRRRPATNSRCTLFYSSETAPSIAVARHARLSTKQGRARTTSRSASTCCKPARRSNRSPGRHPGDRLRHARPATRPKRLAPTVLNVEPVGLRGPDGAPADRRTSVEEKAHGRRSRRRLASLSAPILPPACRRRRSPRPSPSNAVRQGQADAGQAGTAPALLAVTVPERRDADRDRRAPPDRDRLAQRSHVPEAVRPLLIRTTTVNASGRGNDRGSDQADPGGAEDPGRERARWRCKLQLTSPRPAAAPPPRSTRPGWSRALKPARR